jgi:hypothetical protein
LLVFLICSFGFVYFKWWDFPQAEWISGLLYFTIDPEANWNTIFLASERLYRIFGLNFGVSKMLKVIVVRYGNGISTNPPAVKT